jgi:hypothetical protein
MTTPKTNADLVTFGKHHLTYINQFFGDETVREIICEVFPSEKYKLVVEESGPEFEGSFHHYVETKPKPNPKNTKKTKTKKICSVQSGHQDMGINKNDTLCQSYSLLSYFDIPIVADLRQRQLDMIDMYRNVLLGNPAFVKALGDVTISANRTRWEDFTHPYTGHYIPVGKTALLSNIRRVLDEWEAYGYLYFIGNGRVGRVL